ncbi:hypothetical protein PPSIR1_38926 [Plesiocystis pacifica SIR-1]|uniref:Uncharacterized protein n=1 Tax=Plesiocystis pacifica SIR-1 TaxID=391625 RepID=A6GGD6_9BACT|nr:hypothetical protein PPSIR1_38926 [Plesiocystis pacifica SIR-1]
MKGELAELRAQTGPDAAARQRMWAELALAGGPEPDLDPEPEPDLGDGGASTGGMEQLGYAAKVVGATASMTAAGLLALRLGVLGVQALAPGDPAVDTELELETHALEEAEPEPEAALEPEGGEPSLEEPSAGRAEPGARPEAPAAKAPAQAELPGAAEDGSAAKGESTGASGSLAAELELLQAAREAPDSASALAQLAEHRRRFPEGQLVDERELLAVERACTSSPSEAQAAAQTLLARGRLGLARVREACPSLELPE